jgi:hypothetical protein
MRFKLVPWEALLAGVCLSVTLFFAWPMATTSIFQARDLARAEQVLQGHPIFFGPEATGGGNLPGGLYYWLLALPLATGYGWLAAWVTMAVVAGVMMALLWATLARLFDRESAFIACGFLVWLPWFYMTFFSFMNSSFHPIFLVAALIALGFAFSDSGFRRPAWFAACAAIGLGIQLHFTITFILLAGIFMQWNPLRLDIPRLERKWFWQGLGFFALPLLPWVIWKISGQSLGQPSPEYIGAAQNVVPNFVQNLLKLGDGWAGTITLRGEYNDYVILTKMFLPSVVALVLILILGWDVKATGRAKQLGLVWGCCLAFGALPILGLFPYIARTRYLMPFHFALAFFIAAKFYQLPNAYRARFLGLFFIVAAGRDVWRNTGLLRNMPVYDLLVPFALVAFGAVAVIRSSLPRLTPWALVFCAMVAFRYGQFHIAHSISPAYLGIGPMQEAMGLIHERTGWTFEQARARIYWLNVRYESTPEFVYRLVEKQNRARTPAASTADGFFIAQMRRQDQNDALDGNFKRWLERLDLEPTILADLKQNRIKLGEPAEFHWGFVVPYTVDRSGPHSPHFQNLGEYYQPAPEKTPGADNQASKVQAGHANFQFNDCAGQDRYCRFRFELKSAAAENKNTELSVTLSGPVISHSSPWISPDWSQGLSNVFLKYRCTEKSPEQKVIVASRVGYLPGSENSTIINGALMAPFSRSLRVPCSQPLHQVSMGYEQAHAYAVNRAVELPGRELSVQEF